MKKIQVVNDDYQGHVDICRHACRGIVIKDGKILLCYESNEDKYIIPGGGVEDNETLDDCCARELMEETGVRVKPIENYLDPLCSHEEPPGDLSGRWWCERFYGGDR